MGCILCCNIKSLTKSEAEETKAPEYSWDQRKKLDPKDYTIENVTDGCTGRLPGSINGEQFIVQSCKNSRIYLLDYIGTISIDDCTHCDFIIGPVKTSIFIRDCSHCNFLVACQQFRTRDCLHLNVFLSCTSQPIIESTTKFKVSPYQLYYPDLSKQFKAANLSPFNCNWSDIYDFTPVNDQGPNFSLLSEDCRPFQVLTLPSSVLNKFINGDHGDGESEFSEKVIGMEITDAREQSVVPYTYGSRRSVATTEATNVTSLVMIFHCSNQERIAHDLISYMNEKSSEIFLIKSREMKLSIETARGLLGNKISDNDIIMQGPVVSLEYIGSKTVSETMSAFKALQVSEPHIDNVIFVSDDPDTARRQIDLINNATNMGMNTA